MMPSVVPDLYKQAWHPFFNTCSTVMSKQPHWTLPRVLWIHAITAALKVSLFCAGSTTFLLPGLPGMLSGHKDIDSFLLTSKGLIHTLKKGAEVLWSAIWRYWSATWRCQSLLPAYRSLPAPPAGTAGGHFQGHFSPWPNSLNDQVVQWTRKGMQLTAAIGVAVRWAGGWWGKEYFPAKSVYQASLPCECKKKLLPGMWEAAMVRKQAARHRWAQFFHW